MLSLAGYFVSWQQSVFVVKANANLIGNVNNQSSKHYGDSKVMDLQGRSENSTIAKLVKRKNKFSIFLVLRGGVWFFAPHLLFVSG